MSSIESILEEIRKRLVETDTRNRLIHVNRNNPRANVINIINERSDNVLEILRANREKMRFLPLGTEEAEVIDDLSFEAIENNYDESRHTDKFLKNNLTPDALQKRLLKISRDAKTAEEEQGINVLYLALGFLKWYESDISDVVREAPLILLPVELVRNKRTSSFEVIDRGEDIVTNLPLRERLRNDHAIELPDIDIDDNENWKPSTYFDRVRERVSPQKRWEVNGDAIQLGFFSFGKLLMLTDLNPKKWSSGALTGNPIIRSLLSLSEGFEPDPPLFDNDQKLDSVLKPADIIQVLDADSSQTKVIEEVRKGRNLVVQGPPGTGKSQTITNILAAAAYDGKKVLFVAEKMAALAVVHRRLVKAGLEDLCVELHSKKTNKKAFLDSLRKTLENNRNQYPNNLTAENLTVTRDLLNDISDALHSNLDNRDYTPYEVLSNLIGFSGRNVPPPEISYSHLEKIKKRKESEMCNAIKGLEQLSNDMGDFSKHPFAGTKKVDLQPYDSPRLEGVLDKTISLINEWKKRDQKISTLLGIENANSISKHQEHLDLLKHFTEAPPSDRAVWSVVISNVNDNQLGEAIELGKCWILKKKEFAKVASDALWTSEISNLRQELAKGVESWVSRVFGKYRSACSDFQALLKQPIPKQAARRLEWLDSLIEAQSRKRKYEDKTFYLEDCLGNEWRGDETPFEEYANCIRWMAEFPGSLEHYSLETLMSIIQESSNPIYFQATGNLDQKLQSKILEIQDKLGLDYLHEVDFSSLDLIMIKEKFTHIRHNLSKYQEWTDYIAQRGVLSNHGLKSLLCALDKQTLDISEAVNEFRYSLNQARWKHCLDQRPKLIKYKRINRNDFVNTFCTLENKRLEEVRKAIRSKHLNQLPQGAAGEMGYLRTEIAKRKKHKPIRKTMERAGKMIQRIKPIFLLSPISVAQFLPPEKLEFDLLVMDEASQVRPEDALGAIARSRQIVVVGDQKQLPPTSFFERLTDSDEEDNPDEAVKVESILSLCEARGMNRRMLEWHYRSRDPSLIAVSNREFYEDKLILPPMPTETDASFGLSFNQIPGVYSSAREGGGRKGTNKIEAEAVATRLANLIRNKPHFSFGVVTFSKSQADMMTEVLELRRRSDPTLDEGLRENRSEPVFVKNIENVQGDERDIILISVGYGPHEPNGQLVNMRFGPINAEGGERRLNVIFSRARIACEVFASFNPDDINLNRTQGEGPRILKTFLQFAKTGHLPTNDESVGKADSEFEEDVAREIIKFGFEVEHQVGTAGFKIDLGVRANDGSGHFVLAVECDGATYHSALWARERDRLRQQVLEKSGWKFHRIWSTDWFYRKEEEIKKLRDVLEKSRSLNLDQFIKDANNDGAILEPQAEDENYSEDRGMFLAEANYDVAPYRKAEIPSSSTIEPHERELSQVQNMVIQIVKVEGVVHIDEIERRYAKAHGKTRVGKRISDLVKRGALAAKEKGVITDAKGFWGTKDQFDNVPVRNRSNEVPPLTKPKYLSEAEILACAKLIKSESGEVNCSELVKTISRVLGYKRAGQEFQRRVKDILTQYGR